ncbi:22499_t:CDS:2 [Gigaspora rosea]|nr:22499_t:CDS:2 [Gigaspora rosea]
MNPEVKKFQVTSIWNRGKVEGPTWEIFDRIYEVGCKVKKGEDKGVKIGIKLSITYSKFAKVDHMDEMKDLKNY